MLNQFIREFFLFWEGFIHKEDGSAEGASTGGSVSAATIVVGGILTASLLVMAPMLSDISDRAAACIRGDQTGAGCTAGGIVGIGTSGQQPGVFNGTPGMQVAGNNDTAPNLPTLPNGTQLNAVNTQLQQGSIPLTTKKGTPANTQPTLQQFVHNAVLDAQMQNDPTGDQQTVANLTNAAFQDNANATTITTNLVGGPIAPQVLLTTQECDEKWRLLVKYLDCGDWDGDIYAYEDCRDEGNTQYRIVNEKIINSTGGIWMGAVWGTNQFVETYLCVDWVYPENRTASQLIVELVGRGDDPALAQQAECLVRLLDGADPTLVDRLYVIAQSQSDGTALIGQLACDASLSSLDHLLLHINLFGLDDASKYQILEYEQLMAVWRAEAAGLDYMTVYNFLSLPSSSEAKNAAAQVIGNFIPVGQDPTIILQNFADADALTSPGQTPSSALTALDPVAHFAVVPDDDALDASPDPFEPSPEPSLEPDDQICDSFCEGWTVFAKPILQLGLFSVGNREGLMGNAVLNFMDFFLATPGDAAIYNLFSFFLGGLTGIVGPGITSWVNTNAGSLFPEWAITLLGATPSLFTIPAAIQTVNGVSDKSKMDLRGFGVGVLIGIIAAGFNIPVLSAVKNSVTAIAGDTAGEAIDTLLPLGDMLGVTIANAVNQALNPAFGTSFSPDGIIQGILGGVLALGVTTGAKYLRPEAKPNSLAVSALAQTMVGGIASWMRGTFNRNEHTNVVNVLVGLFGTGAEAEAIYNQIGIPLNMPGPVASDPSIANSAGTGGALANSGSSSSSGSTGAGKPSSSSSGATNPAPVSAVGLGQSSSTTSIGSTNSGTSSTGAVVNAPAGLSQSSSTTSIGSTNSGTSSTGAVVNALLGGATGADSK